MDFNKLKALEEKRQQEEAENYSKVMSGHIAKLFGSSTEFLSKLDFTKINNNDEFMLAFDPLVQEIKKYALENNLTVRDVLHCVTRIEKTMMSLTADIKDHIQFMSEDLEEKSFGKKYTRLTFKELDGLLKGEIMKVVPERKTVVNTDKKTFLDKVFALFKK